MQANEVTRKCVAIVAFGPVRYADDAYSPGIGVQAGHFYQVTIDPNMLSGEKEFIRFGNYPGDELIGWQLASRIGVGEILGYWDGDTPPVMHYGKASE